MVCEFYILVFYYKLCLTYEKCNMFIGNYLNKLNKEEKHIKRQTFINLNAGKIQNIKQAATI